MRPPTNKRGGCRCVTDTSIEGPSSLTKGQVEGTYEPDKAGIETGAAINAGMIFRKPIKECRKLASAAFLGYLAMDVLNPPTGSVWGEFNDRTVSGESIKKLKNKFLTDLANCDEETAMFVGVKKAWVSNLEDAKREIDGMYIEELPLLQLTAAGENSILLEKLWFFSGNHRRTALQEIVDDLKKGLGEDGTGLMLKEKERDELKAKIEKSSRWAVKLYDRGVWSSL